MDIGTIIIVISVLVVGVLLLRGVHFLGIEHKHYFEGEAVGRLERDLRPLLNKEQKYTYFRYSKWPFMRPTWNESNYKKMRKEIVDNCTKYSGRGIWFDEAKYSFNINMTNKTIHYVVGRNNFDFSGKIT
jgi:hypothetical protein